MFSVAGPYMRQYIRTKDVHAGFFVLRLRFMGYEAVNHKNVKAYDAIELARYHWESPRNNYEIYLLTYEKNLIPLALNDEDMLQGRVVHKIMKVIECPWLLVSQIFVTVSDEQNGYFY